MKTYPRHTITMLLGVCLAAAAPLAHAESLGRTAKARAQLERLEEAQRAFHEGVAAHETGDREGAQRAYEAALRADPDFTEAMVNLARVLVETGKLGAAGALLEAASLHSPGYVSTHEVRGLLAMAAGQPRRARNALERALQSDPRRTSARINLAVLLMEQGLTTDAEAQLDRVLEQDPHHATALFDRAVLFDRQRRYVEAIRDYERFVDRCGTSDPDRPAAAARLQLLRRHSSGEPLLPEPAASGPTARPSRGREPESTSSAR